MEVFAKIVKSFQPLTIPGRSSILDILQASETPLLRYCSQQLAVILFMSFLLLVLKTYHKLTFHSEMFNSHRNQLILVVIQLSGFCII